MLAQWTGDVVGKMHIYQLKIKDVADKVGWNPKYLSAVLNGHKHPKNAEAKIKIAIDLLRYERCADRFDSDELF